MILLLIGTLFLALLIACRLNTLRSRRHGIRRKSRSPVAFYTNKTGDTIMPRGDKSKYTDKQKRQAEHIEEGYEDRGVPDKEAERRAWATVNRMTKGGKKPGGSGRGQKIDSAPAKKGGRLGGAAAARRPAAAKKASAKKAAATRARHKKGG
jgi:hypothetical protein